MRSLESYYLSTNMLLKDNFKHPGFSVAGEEKKVTEEVGNK